MAVLPFRRNRRRVTGSVPRSGPLLASGMRIDVSDAKSLAAYRKRLSSAQAWQSPAFVFNAVVPILGFGHDYVRDALSRVRPFPAILGDDPSEPPVAITDETMPDGVPSDFADLCDAITQRLEPFPYFMGRGALLNDVAGELHVAIVPDPNETDGERVRVLSNQEIMGTGGAWKIKQNPNDTEGIAIPSGAPFWRIWTPDPEWEDQPFSHMVRLNDVCQRYLNLTRHIKAFSLSRNAMTGKWIVVADEFSLESGAADGVVGTEDAGDGEGGSDPFFDDLMAMGAEAIMDPESASAVMNPVIRAPYDLIKDGIATVDTTRPGEALILEYLTQAIDEIATGINLPREIVLGVGDTNHWNAEEIKTQTWLNHLEPRAYNLLAATTVGFFRPLLLANDIDPEIVRRCCLWYDPSWYLGSPDVAESADFGLEQGAIGWDSWRQAKGFDEDDAPDDAERAAYLAFRQALNVRTTVSEDTQGGEAPAVEEAALPAPGAPKAPPGAPPEAKQTVPDQADETAPEGQKKKAGNLRAASAVPSALARLGDRHVQIERDLRARLLVEAETAVVAALRKTGMTVRSKLVEKLPNGKRPPAALAALRAQIADVPYVEIPSVVGRPIIEAFGLDDTKILDAALADLEPKYHRLVLRAQHAAAQTAARATGLDFDYDRLDGETDDDRRAGWGVLSAGLVALAAGLLYQPHPDVPTRGEFNGDSLIPAGLVRAALDTAGGVQPGQREVVTRGAEVVVPGAPTGTADPSGGATMGPTMLDQFKEQLGIADEGWTWQHGDTDREFEPHVDLDGEFFASWEDDVLVNDGDWPDFDFFFPGDHLGCSCLAAPTYVQAGEQEVATTDETVDYPTPLTRTQEADALDAPRRERAEAPLPEATAADPFPAQAQARDLFGPEFVKRDALGGQADWEQLAQQLVAEAKASGLYQEIAADGVQLPIQVFVPKQGAPEITSGHHRLAVANDLKQEVPVRWYGKGYYETTGEQSNIPAQEYKAIERRLRG